MTVHSHADVATPLAARYLQQLCKHFGHRLAVTFDARTGRIPFAFGECTLAAEEGVLRIDVTAPDEAQLVRTQEVVASHLARFAFREPPAIEWVSQPPRP